MYSNSTFLTPSTSNLCLCVLNNRLPRLARYLQAVFIVTNSFGSLNKLETWNLKYGFGNCKSPFVNISCHLQWEKLPDFNAFPVNLHWPEDSNLFPACWILIGQFKFPARQPYAGQGLVIDWFFRFCFRLRQSSFHWIINDGVVNGIGRNGDVLILPTPIPLSLCMTSDFRFSLGHKLSSDSDYDSDSDSVASENQP